MATEAEDLQTALDNVIAKILEISANPKPSYSIDGQSVSWGDYYRMLAQMRKDLKEAIINAEGPFDHVIQMRSA